MTIDMTVMIQPQKDSMRTLNSTLSVIATLVGRWYLC